MGLTIFDFFQLSMKFIVDQWLEISFQLLCNGNFQIYKFGDLLIWKLTSVHPYDMYGSFSGIFWEKKKRKSKVKLIFGQEKYLKYKTPIEHESPETNLKQNRMDSDHLW